MAGLLAHVLALFNRFIAELSIESVLATLMYFSSTIRVSAALFFGSYSHHIGLKTVGYPLIQLAGSMDFWLSNLPYSQAPSFPIDWIIVCPPAHSIFVSQGGRSCLRLFTRKNAQIDRKLLQNLGQLKKL
jgi:hypothetical protein